MVKGSKSDKETTYEIRDIVLAKVRGYPPWPGMVRSSSVILLCYLLTYIIFLSYCLQVVDPQNVSKDVIRERPKTKSRPSTACGSFPEETSKFHVVPIFTLPLN
jgi:hypothetical protein